MKNSSKEEVRTAEEKTLQQYKDQVAAELGYKSFEHLYREFRGLRAPYSKIITCCDEAAELYASQFKSKSEEVEAENEELRKKCQWISVKERLPEGNGFSECIVWKEWGMNSAMKMARFNTKIQEFIDSRFDIIRGVTHWQPLPSPPEVSVGEEKKD